MGERPSAAMHRDAAHWIALAQTAYGGGVRDSAWHDVTSSNGHLEIFADRRRILTLSQRRRRYRIRLVRTSGPSPAPRQRSLSEARQRTPIVTCRAKTLSVGSTAAAVMRLPNADRWLIRAHVLRDHVAICACPAPAKATPLVRVAVT
jgi:hypothetical protein